MNETGQSKWEEFSQARTLVAFAAMILIGGIFWFRQNYITVIKPYRVGNEVVRLEITQTIDDRQKGLSGRDEIGEADGMIFFFDVPARHAMWMKDMKMPIDIVWVAANEVVDIAPVVQPEPGVASRDLTRYYPRLDASWVLEFPSGWAEEYGLKIGDPILPL